MSQRQFFFLTPRDALNWLQQIEVSVPLNYAPLGSFTQEPPVIERASEFNGLGIATAGDSAREQQYLVIPQYLGFNSRHIPGQAGGMRVLLYPDTNPGSVVLTPAGQFGSGAIIIGELATALDDDESLDLYDGMLNVLRRNGTLIDGILVGLDALAKTKEGFRLCERMAAPPERDLHIQ